MTLGSSNARAPDRRRPDSFPELELCLVAGAEWQARAAAEIEVIRQTVGPRARALEHIGSTAVPGLVGKPVVDLLLAVDGSLRRRDVWALRSIGYHHLRVRTGGRLSFRKGTPRTFSLHVESLGSPEWRDRVAFREALRRDPELAARYSRLKREALLERRNLAGYGAAKADFVTEVLRNDGRISEACSLMP